MPIYLRLTVNGIPTELSVKRSCDSAKWDSKANRATGTKEETKALNQYLDAFENKVFNIKRQLIEREVITATRIKEVFLGKAEPKR